jgi:long-chain acyl-CoA synthetase
MSETRREALLAKIADKTLVDVFHETCEAHAEVPALVERTSDGVVARTWEDYRRDATTLAVGLRRLGLQPGEHVALMLSNRPEHVLLDVATLLAGGVPTSVYVTMADEQLAYVAGDCGAVLAVVEDEEMLARWRGVREQMEGLRTLVVIDPPAGELPEGVVSLEQVRALGEQAGPDDLDGLARIRDAMRPGDTATLIYTSGTTGPPKGAMITHRNVLYMLAALPTIFDLQTGYRIISYLPLAHIAERVVSHYLAIGQALTVYFVRDISQLVETLQGARPHLLFGVPRVWEKVHTRLLERIADTEPAVKRRLAERAVAVGRRRADLRLAGEPVPRRLQLQHALLDRLVLAKIRDGLGLDRIVHVASGAATLDPELVRFFAGLGLEILDVYGLTETTAVVACNHPGRTRPGTVGFPLPGARVRVGQDGEVLVNGPHVFAGYHNRPEATRDVLDEDGWLATGDLGVFDADGYLRITGRRKDLLVTSGGKNIAPAVIEDAIRTRSPLISQVCVIGDRRPYVGALIALDAEGLAEWAQRHGRTTPSVGEAAAAPEILAEVERAVAAANQRLSRPEQVKRWTVVPVEWTVEQGEVTPTQKMRRAQVLDHFPELVSGLYEETS